jgi:hypothetical protein
MQDYFEQLKSLKELLESGAISKTEYDRMKAELLRESMAGDGVKSAMEPSKSTKLLKKYKWVLILTPVLLIAGFFVWNSFKADSKMEAENLAQEYCDCQKQNNEEYIKQLNDFIQTFDSKGFKYSSDVEQKLTKLSNEYKANNLNVSISSCFSKLGIKMEQIRQKFKPGTSEFKEFDFAYQNKIAQNIDLVSQIEVISNLEQSASQKKSSILYSNQDALNSRKYNITSLMNTFYYLMTNKTLDAYDYFAYNVEKYFGRKNLTPTDINMYLNAETDYTDAKFKFISETLQLVSSDDESETWEYSTEFQTFRPSKEKFQISNVWYEIKLNKAGKISSYREKKAENTKFLTAEEFNNLYNENSNQSVEEDW